MTTVEIVLLVVGFIFVCLSFFLSRRTDGGGALYGEGTTQTVWTELEEKMIRDRVDEILRDYQTELVDDTENQMNRLCNEKIMAIDEFSQQILSKMDANHQEVVFMYNMLNEKQQEIAKVAPSPDEEERLEEIRTRARNWASIKKTYNAALELLFSREPAGIFESLDTLEKYVSQLADHEESFAERVNAIADFRASMDSLASLLQNPPEPDVSQDLNEIEERLYTLQQLKRKLHRTIPQICALQKEIEENLSFLDSCALDLSHLTKEEEGIRTTLTDLLARIRPLRHAAAETFTARLEAELRDLAFSERVRVICEYLPKPIWKDITDEQIRFLWAPNPGQTPQPLTHIASGGELSRFLLALTSLETRTGDNTYIFDEVDAGVGGMTLGKLAEKLYDLAETHQIILITHWPQLAKRASRHFQIQKHMTEDSTVTVCHALGEEERKQELARRAGGGELGEAFLKSLANAEREEKNKEDKEKNPHDELS